jgi:DNA (cytosine-5)-methyltransferase 1
VLTQPTLVDMYSGAGGVTQGFKNHGFRTLAAIEYDPTVAHTYKTNHPEVKLYDRDVKTIYPQEILRDCDLEQGELTVLSVCAPCQPFSRQTRLNRKDNRTKLVLEMIRFVAVLRPQFAIMENVPGLGKGKNKRILDKLVNALRENLGYKVAEPIVVNAVNYGVPQFRKRLILLCSRDDIDLVMPVKTHASPDIAEELDRLPWCTVRDAFIGIHRLAAGQTSQTDELHKARAHTPINIERLKHIPSDGGSRHSLPEHLVLKCHKKKNIGYNDVYGRLDSRRPANTLTTGCTNITKGRFAHPTANRAITPREAACLQTFPRDYQFSGNYDQISSQIGNAVPVNLAEAFAKYFYSLWQEEFQYT